MLEETNISSDVTAGTPSGGAEESAAISPSGGVEGGLQTASPSAATDEGASGASPAEFDVPDTDEDLKGQEQNPHVQEFIKYRQKVRALKSDLTALEPWKSFTGLGDPDEVKTYAELGKGLLTVVRREDGSEVVDPATGLPQLTATPGLQMLARRSPDAFVQMVADALDLQWSDGQGGTTTVRDRVIADTLKQSGLNPANLQRYAEWEKTGPPVAPTGLVTQEELSEIDPHNHEAFKALPALKRRDLLNLKNSTDPDEQSLFEWEISEAQKNFEAQKSARAFTEAQAQERQRQEAAFEQGIQTATQVRVSEQFQRSYKSTYEQIAQWKPTSDDKLNARQYRGVMNVLVNMTDERMDFDTALFLQELGFDNPETELKEIRRLSDSWQGACAKAERARGARDTYQMQIAEADASREHGKLMAKMGQIASRLVDAQNGVNVVGRQEKEARNTAATNGRPVIGAQNTSAASATSSLPVPLPPGVVAGSPEATELVMRHFTGGQ